MKQAKIKLLHPDAKLPTRGTEKSTGYDITCLGVKTEFYEVVDPVFVYVYKHTYNTGLAIQPPEGYDIKLFPRSSIHKKYAWLANSIGLCDEDYRGEYMMVFYSFSSIPPFEIGDRIGQIVIQKRENIGLVIVDELESTERGEGGFGSTGT